MSKHAFYPFYQPYDGKKKVYVSGPMTGYPDNNYDAFHEAAEGLRARGYAVCNPAETDQFIGELTHEQYLRFDFERVLEADFLVALPHWEFSLGALSELLMAVRMGVKCWRWENFEEYNIITYDDVAQAISDIHIGNAETTTDWDVTAGVSVS